MIDGFRRLATSGNAIRIEGERELKRGTLYGLFTLTHNGIIHQCGITSYHVVRPTPNGPGVRLNKIRLAVLLWKGGLARREVGYFSH